MYMLICMYDINVSMYYIRIIYVFFAGNTSTSQHTSSSPAHAKLVATIAVNIPHSSGVYQYNLPQSQGLQSSFDGSPTYFIEIRGDSYSNFSEYFTVKPSLFVTSTMSWHCCFGTVL